ncbi:MAG: SpoIIIAH-like family protein [Acetobacter sp.]|nr:SpoIIIAH-like family protein [Bacteroides sp.]MCM1340594.1 SpoIIIAH-like family protein [Acetobacter sp.]MCM1433334.1 SpoIIIAH-like family protein [Clostridiales bacterium]
MNKNNNETKKSDKVKIMTEEELKRKKATRKTKFAISCFVLLLAVGVLGNWYWENSDISAKVSTISSAKEKILGEATFVDATTEPGKESEYFSQARVDRQSARDASLEKLQKIVDSQTADKTAQKEASEGIALISKSITIENKIETLVTAKGVKNCIAIINDDATKVDVIVDVDELNDTTILQIKEIAVSQLNCTYNNVTIIQSK